MADLLQAEASRTKHRLSRIEPIKLQGKNPAKNLCKEENCDRPPFGRGWCQRHYRRLLTYGDPKIGRDLDEGRSDEPLVRLPPPSCRRDGCETAQQSPWLLLRMLQRVAQRRAPTPSVAAEKAVAALYPSRLGQPAAKWRAPIASTGQRLKCRPGRRPPSQLAGALSRLSVMEGQPGIFRTRGAGLHCSTSAAQSGLRGLLAATSMSSLHHGISASRAAAPMVFGWGPFVQVARLNILPIAMRMQAPMKPAIK